MNRFATTIVVMISLVLAIHENSWATSATATAIDEECWINAIGSATFSSYEVCTKPIVSTTPPECHMVNSGSVALLRNNDFLCSSRSDGSASCSKQVNAAILTNGSHCFVAKAHDYKGFDVTDTYCIEIDNTPRLTITSPSSGEVVEGRFDLTGTVTFRCNPEGDEGSTSYFLNGSPFYKYIKTWDTTDVHFSYNNDDSSVAPLNAAMLDEGDYSIKVRAKAKNGSYKDETVTFIIQNKPEIDISTPSDGEKVEGLFDFTGTVEFKDNPDGYEGSTYYFLDGSPYYKYMNWREGKNISFSYNNDNSKYYLNAATMTNGEHSIKIKAKAMNGAYREESVTYIVDNTPEITIATPNPLELITDDFDFTGTVTFKDNPDGYEGRIFYYLDSSQLFVKYCEGKTVSFSYDADKPAAYNDLYAYLKKRSSGIHTLKLMAVSANNTQAIATVNILICNDNSITDTDGDGITDCMDECPLEYGNAEDGCYHDPLDTGRDPKDPKRDCRVASEKGDPISLYTGNSVESTWDLRFTSPFSGGLIFKRFYNSQSETATPMGYGWTHNYNVRLQMEMTANKSYLLIVDDTGFGRYFSVDSLTGAIDAEFNERTSLTADSDTYIWHREDGRVYTFDADTYRLLYVDDPIGNRQSLTYDTATELLSSVIDEDSGRSLEFSYTDGLVSTIRLFSGSVDGGVQVTYGHDTNGNLITVTYADGSGFVYEYNDIDNGPTVAPFINNMTRKSDVAGNLLATWAYDDQDRCYNNDSGDGQGVTMDYGTTADAVIVTDAYGVSKTYTLAAIDLRQRISGVSDGSGCTTCADEPVRWEYDDDLNVTEIEYANGRIDRFSGFDDRGNAGMEIQAAGSADENTITTTWHPTLNAPLTRTEQSVLSTGNKIITWDYDSDGDEVANADPSFLVHRIIVTGFTHDASGAVVAVESITKFSYEANGRLLGVDGPLSGTGDATGFTYDASTGDLLTMNRPVSGTTTFGDYDAAGRPGMATDANGNSLAYAYDGRGRITTMTRLWDNAVTEFTYTLAGKPDKVTLPNGATLDYEYESVYGRLTGITDALGNTTTYAHDDQGNVIETAYNKPSGTDTFWRGFDYQYPDRPGRLWKQINPDDTWFEYAYDTVGNLNRITDPAGKVTTHGHDLLNRQTSMTQPGSITTGMNYDEQGNLVLVTDAESRTTEYVVDDLGRTVSVISPDTGTTRFAYDTAGNMLSKTDANGIIVSYSYDDEYRLIGISYPDSTQDVTYTYDQGINGKGRLTGMVDVSGDYSYEWDEAGNLIFEEKTIDGVAYTTGYACDAAGLLTEMTYPDGTVVSYGRDDAGNVSLVSIEHDGVTTVLASDIDYLPFGPMQSMTLGNGIGVNRSFDLLYRMTGSVATGIQDKTYGLDLLGNVTGVVDNLDSTRDLAFYYDDLYRLTDADGIFGSLSFDMDDTGNRLSRTTDSLTETYGYTSGTSLLDQITGSGTVDIITDAVGNTTTHGNRIFTYDQNNRLTGVQEDGVTLASYVTSADGRRIKKTVDGNTTVFHYNLQGRLIAESDGQGNPTKLYFYLNGEPLAMVVSQTGDLDGDHDVDGSDLALFLADYGPGCTGSACDSDFNGDGGVDIEDLKIIAAALGHTATGVYYYHNDRLGAPQRMTNASGTIAWAADYLPFGNVNITVETVENNLRFAGQYYDAETSLHYNYHRYYDPIIGRYLNADPIGLGGGINLYAYCQNDPVNHIDPYGLFIGSLISKAGRWVTGQTAQEAYISGKIIDSGVAATLVFDDGTVVPKTTNQYINDALLGLEGYGAVQTASLASITGGAALAGSAPVWLPVGLSGLAGIEIGGFFNDTYERISGQSFGDDIYDWLHPQNQESECK